MNKNKLRPPTLPFALLAVALSISAFSQTTTAPSPDPKSIPAVDGAIGPCSADFTVTDAAASPVYAAKIKVHIAYGFMNARKLDLEVELAGVHESVGDVDLDLGGVDWGSGSVGDGKVGGAGADCA